MERCEDLQFHVFTNTVSFLFGGFSYHNGQCRYKVIKEVGNGTFGSVWRALSKQSGEVVRASIV